MLGKIIENVRVAYTGLVSNKLRAGLTMLGITIGIGAVIILVSVGQAVESFIVEQFSSIGSNLIFVVGDLSPTAGAGGDTNFENLFIPLTESDIAGLKDRSRAPDIRIVAPAAAVTSTVIYEGRELDAQVAGVTDAHFEVMNLDMIMGRAITQDDLDHASRIALNDETGLETIFNNEYPIGKRVRIGDVSFTIEGVMENAGGAAASQGPTQIFVPLTTAQRFLSSQRTLNGEYIVQEIMVVASTQKRTDAAIQEITDILREEHNLKDDEDNDFRIIAQTEMLQSLSTVTGLLTAFLGVVAGISLLVGGIGIMNIMLVTVTERTKEIGLRKAVGAQRIDILIQFLVESIALSLIGGIVGTSLAALAAFLATSLIPDLTVVIQTSSIILASGICIGIGTFFGAYPANRAAGLNPIDALRYE